MSADLKRDVMEAARYANIEVVKCAILWCGVGQNYNVEYYDGNGKVQSFNANLIDTDEKYFYFKRPSDGGMIMLEATCIRTMISKSLKE